MPQREHTAHATDAQHALALVSVGQFPVEFEFIAEQLVVAKQFLIQLELFFQLELVVEFLIVVQFVIEQFAERCVIHAAGGQQRRTGQPPAAGGTAGCVFPGSG